MLITEWNDNEYREVMREEGAGMRSLEIARNMKADGDGKNRPQYRLIRRSNIRVVRTGKTVAPFL